VQFRGAHRETVAAAAKQFTLEFSAPLHQSALRLSLKPASPLLPHPALPPCLFSSCGVVASPIDRRRPVIGRFTVRWVGFQRPEAAAMRTSSRQLHSAIARRPPVRLQMVANDMTYVPNNCCK